MKIEDLSAITKIASRISNPSSLTNLYRSIQLEPDGMKVCSEFGNLAIALDPTGLTKSALLDCSAVGTVASSLPSKADIVFTEDGNQLKWKCENAGGRWNIVVSDHTIPAISHDKFPWVPSPALGDALNLAGCACQAHAVSIGLYGIACIADGNKLRLISSNSVSLAESVVDKGSFPVSKVTLRPPVHSVIGALIQACPSAKLDITDKGIFIQGDWLQAHLPAATDLDHDVKKIADNHRASDQCAKINTQAVKRFITRARGLSDRHTSFTISMSVKEGNLALQHSGIASATEEFFAAEGLDPTISYESVPMPADLLLIALGFVDRVSLDYLKDQKLVMHGDNPEFHYVLGGGE